MAEEKPRKRHADQPEQDGSEGSFTQKRSRLFAAMSSGSEQEQVGSQDKFQTTTGDGDSMDVKSKFPNAADVNKEASLHMSSQETVMLSESEDESVDKTPLRLDLEAKSESPALSPMHLWKDPSLEKDASIIAKVIPCADRALVFEALDKHRAHSDRLNVATLTVLDSTTSTAPVVQGSVVPRSGNTSRKHCQQATVTEEGQDQMKKMTDNLKTRPDSEVKAADNSLCIFNQATKLHSEFPHVDPSTIYDLLEKCFQQGKDEKSVQEILRAQSSSSAQTAHSSSGSVSAQKPSLLIEDSITNDPLAQADPVFRDMRIISRMFPEKEQNLIYALVEAHYYKSDRVHAVIEELLQDEKNSQNKIILSESSENLLVKSDWGAETGELSSVKVKPALLDDCLQSDVHHLQDVFPDCDPNYLFECLEICKDRANRVKIVATEMFEQRNYPKLKDVAEKQSKTLRRQRLHNMNFTILEFLAKFPDPVSTFSTYDKVMKENYKAHVIAQLKHDFPDFKQSFVSSVANKFHFHLLPTIKQLQAERSEILGKRGISKKLRRVQKIEDALIYPEEPDEYFFYELWFLRNEQKIREHFEQKALERMLQVEEARASGELYECSCCFEEECLFQEMNICADGHLFCRQCIARSVQAAFGEGKTTFPCLTGFCQHQIPLSVLREVLPSSLFSKILRKLQEEEVKQAGIADLVDCPFCSFATIMSDPNNRVFHCLNPECLQDSCRLCREPSHVPLKCEEVEKHSETHMRTFIEKRVTEAMLRKCHRCGKFFVKQSGCNKMTCTCGATSCYVCRQPNVDYKHFNRGCNESDMKQLHKKEMEKAAEEAKAEYLQAHPEAAQINLKFDPIMHIQTSMLVVQEDLEDQEDYSDDQENYSDDQENYSDDQEDYSDDQENYSDDQEDYSGDDGFVS